eukprot:TRINITY_DN51143_c0_g1_i1.p1 TRINITY_DN51143_c0_g1~~TRINITY_DN51143_c0_g1_i1.p1  ORF type:complete len:462 (+),score=116.15 TRINITY_DN51143_c0_g1_i1:89-1474(+)
MIVSLRLAVIYCQATLFFQGVWGHRAPFTQPASLEARSRSATRGHINRQKVNSEHAGPSAAAQAPATAGAAEKPVATKRRIEVKAGDSSSPAEKKPPQASSKLQDAKQKQEERKASPSPEKLPRTQQHAAEKAVTGQAATAAEGAQPASVGPAVNTAGTTLQPSKQASPGAVKLGTKQPPGADEKAAEAQPAAAAAGAAETARSSVAGGAVATPSAAAVPALKAAAAADAAVVAATAAATAAAQAQEAAQAAMAVLRPSLAAVDEASSSARSDTQSAAFAHSLPGGKLADDDGGKDDDRPPKAQQAKTATTPHDASSAPAAPNGASTAVPAAMQAESKVASVAPAAAETVAVGAVRPVAAPLQPNASAAFPSASGTADTGAAPMQVQPRRHGPAEFLLIWLAIVWPVVIWYLFSRCRSTTAAEAPKRPGSGLEEGPWSNDMLTCPRRSRQAERGRSIAHLR